MKKNWKKVIASSLAFICTVTAGIATIATNGFGLFNTSQTEQEKHDNPLSIGNFFGKGISVTANADEVSSGTPIFGSVVSDAGTCSSLTSVNTGSVPFTYQDLTLYENQSVVRIGIPVKTVLGFDSIDDLYNGTNYIADCSYFDVAYATMVLKIKNQYPNADLYLCNLIYDDAIGKSYNDSIAAVATMFNCNVVDFSALVPTWSWSNHTLDGLHPNKDGFDLMADILIHSIQESVAKN